MNATSETQLIKCNACGAMNRISSHTPDKEPVCGRCKTPLSAAMHPLTITDDNYAALVERSPLPVLLDLWAPWCGPCRMMSPVIDQLATELTGRVRVAKLNTDEHPMTSQRFRVQGIPTLLILNRGQEVGRLVGAQPKAVILQRLREFL